MVRAVVDWQGQIVTMADRAYLTEAMPMCVVWGEDDRVIPVSHAARAAELAPKARVEILPNAGHFPHKDHPERFVKILNDFVRTTTPATYSRARWRRLLQQGPGPRRRSRPSTRRPRERAGIFRGRVYLVLAWNSLTRCASPAAPITPC